MLGVSLLNVVPWCELWWDGIMFGSGMMIVYMVSWCVWL